MHSCAHHPVLDQLTVSWQLTWYGVLLIGTINDDTWLSGFESKHEHVALYAMHSVRWNDHQQYRTKNSKHLAFGIEKLNFPH